MFAPTLSLMSVALLFFVSRGQLATLPSSDSESSNQEASMENSNPLTSHILDTSKGLPASKVLVKLYKMGNDGSWNFIIEMSTDSDGRVKNLISAKEFTPAIYKMHFDTKSYFTSKGEKTFYPYIEVVFEIEKPEEHYHVPILLNAYGFSTYRGS